MFPKSALPFALGLGSAVASAIQPAPAVTDNKAGTTYVANLDGSISGPLVIQASADGKGVDVYVQWTGFNLADSLTYNYHIHEKPIPSLNGTCASTGKHFTPYVVGDNYACNADTPNVCELGDLSGKYGSIKFSDASAAADWSQSYHDDYLSTTLGATGFFGGLSVVVHKSNGDRVACANFKLVSNGDYTSPDGTTTTTSKSSPKGPTASATWANWDPATSTKTTTSTWANWDPASSTETTTTTKTSTWANWDPVSSTKTTTTTKTSTWGNWDPVSSTTTSTWSNWDPVSSTKTTTTTKTTTPTTWSGWSQWSDSGKGSGNVIITTITSSSCTTPKASDVTSCSTYHLEQGAYPITSSCSTYHLEQSGYPITSSCTTYHLEQTAYPITSSCTTSKSTPTPVCAIVTKTSTITVSATSTTTTATWSNWSNTAAGSPSLSTITTTSCTTAAASTTSSCSTYHLEGTTAFPVTSSCTTYHLETAGYPITSSCTTYHLETTLTNPITSTCFTGLTTPTPVCAIITNVVTVGSSVSATSASTWAAWSTTGSNKNPAATATSPVQVYKGTADKTVAEKFSVAVGALMAGALLL